MTYTQLDLDLRRNKIITIAKKQIKIHNKN
jgi:hypothetical protein